MTSIDRENMAGQGASPTDELKTAARHEYDDARERISGQADRIRREGGATIKTAVTDELDRRKAGVGAEIRTLAEALRHAADEQAQKAGSGVGAAPSSLLGHGAGLLEDLSNGLERQSVNDITRSVSDYARNNPAIFIGGCILAGLAVGRLLTASEQRSGATGSYQPTPPATGAATYAQAQARQPGTEPPIYGTPQAQPVSPSGVASPMVLRREDDNGPA